MEVTAEAFAGDPYCTSPSTFGVVAWLLAENEVRAPPAWAGEGAPAADRDVHAPLLGELRDACSERASLGRRVELVHRGGQALQEDDPCDVVLRSLWAVPLVLASGGLRAAAEGLSRCCAVVAAPAPVAEHRPSRSPPANEAPLRQSRTESELAPLAAAAAAKRREGTREGTLRLAGAFSEAATAHPPQAAPDRPMSGPSSDGSPADAARTEGAMDAPPPHRKAAQETPAARPQQAESSAPAPQAAAGATAPSPPKRRPPGAGQSKSVIAGGAASQSAVGALLAGRVLGATPAADGAVGRTLSDAGGAVGRASSDERRKARRPGDSKSVVPTLQGSSSAASALLGSAIAARQPKARARIGASDAKSAVG